MKKFKVKIDTPWCSKGTIYHYMLYGTYVPDRTIGISTSGANSFAIDHPEKYHDLFEPVEEKSNYEKWQEALFKPISVFDGVSKDLAQALARLIGMKLDQEGFCADKIYKEVCGEG